MTKPDAQAVVAMLIDLWPSRFHWTPAMTALWVERLARPEWNPAQVQAVIRDERVTSDASKPSLQRIIRRCHEVHAEANPKPPVGNLHDPLTHEHWDQIHADRAAAVAWWDGLDQAQRSTVIARCTEALPIFADRWRRFTDAKFSPSPKAVLMLKAAHRAWRDGVRGTGPLTTPGEREAA